MKTLNIATLALVTAAIVLPWRFTAAMVTSGLQTVGTIARHGLAIGAPPPAAFVRIDFAPMNAQGAALLGCMISLTQYREKNSCFAAASSSS